MMNKKIIISDTNSKSLKIKNYIIKIFKKKPLKKINTVIVIGGDGFMLKTLKKNKNKDKKFYGINSGNYGFLMNKFSKKNLFNNIKKSKMIIKQWRLCVWVKKILSLYFLNIIFY